MTNWTKGPWVAEGGTTTGMMVSAPNAPKSKRAVCRNGGPDREGNAHLIAAAPELYEALDAMLSLWGSVMRAQGFDPDHVVEPAQARAALSKARGEAQ